MRRLPFAAALAVALPLLLGACDFEQVIELDVPPYEPRLVLGGFPTPDSVFTVRVGHSASALTPSNFDPLALVVVDARVALFDESGTFLDSLYQSSPFSDDVPTPGLYRSLSGLRPQPGQRYTLRVEAPGLPSVEATTRLPEPPPFFVEVRGVVDEVPGRGRVVRLLVTVPDQPGTVTYSLGAVRSIDFRNGPAYLQPLTFTSGDPILRNGFDDLDVAVEIDVDPAPQTFYGRALFRDLSFDGASYELPLDVDFFEAGDEATEEFTVTLSTLDSDYVRYQQTLALQDVTGDNPFAEPVRIHSNVRDGLGAFAGYTTSQVTLTVE